MPLELGIIGYGRFGRFAATILKRDFDVSVHDSKSFPSEEGIRFVSLAEAARKPVIFLCVPISAVGAVCCQLKPYLVRGQLVLDACSVKEKPLRLMKQILPRGVDVLGTHPLFGPDSARQGIEGHAIVLCPGRGAQQQKVARYLKSLGLRVIVTSAANHDRQMANTQALFHFLARGVALMKIRPGPISTPGPSRLFAEFRDVQNDSLQLFRDMQRENSYSAHLRQKLIKNLIRIDRQLKTS